MVGNVSNSYCGVLWIVKTWKARAICEYYNGGIMELSIEENITSKLPLAYHRNSTFQKTFHATSNWKTERAGVWCNGVLVVVVVCAYRLISIHTLVEVSFARVSASLAIAAQANNQNQQKQRPSTCYACTEKQGSNEIKPNNRWKVWFQLKTRIKQALRLAICLVKETQLFTCNDGRA